MGCCPPCVRHPCFILSTVIVVACALGFLLRMLSLDPDSGVPPVRRLLTHDPTTSAINHTPHRAPRRALLFSPLWPTSGFVPANPTQFSSWSSWQPRTWSFNVNDQHVGSINQRRSGYTGFAWSGQASVEIPKENKEEKDT